MKETRIQCRYLNSENKIWAEIVFDHCLTKKYKKNAGKEEQSELPPVGVVRLT